MDNAIQRRPLLGRLLAGIALVSLLPAGAHAKAAGDTDPAAAIQALNSALLAAMKAGGQAPVAHRFAIVAPAVDQAFDLQNVLKNSVGPRWASLPDDERTRLLAAFRRYTVCNYVANFDTWSGQSFRIDANPRVLSPTQTVVQTWLVPASEAPVEFSYVMQQTSDGWKAVDVLVAGSISRVAVQRSDFRGLLASGGVPALLSSLERKATDLSGGASA
jgi:phospholipid transport system substrate-binding protein